LSWNFLASSGFASESPAADLSDDELVHAVRLADEDRDAARERVGRLIAALYKGLSHPVAPGLSPVAAARKRLAALGYAPTVVRAVR
jgi:hypothetical protein